jgi:putative FmdB family regulatory protein
MPTYEYACRSCGEHLEVVQSFKDDPLTECPACQGELRKVFSAAGIIFKGSGWHVKDYAGSKKPAAASASEGGASEGGSSEGGSSDSSSDGGSSSDTSSSNSGSGTSSDSPSSSPSSDAKSA